MEKFGYLPCGGNVNVDVDDLIYGEECECIVSER